MRRGEFAAAWAVSDEVMRTRSSIACTQLPRHLQQVWDGRPLDGKRVLIRCYHGLGDTIQFVRFVPTVRAIAAEVIVWAQPEVLPLLRTMDAVDRLEPLHDGTPDVSYDIDVEVMELPYIFRSTPATLPSATPYLHASPAARSNDGRFHVALVTRVGAWDRLRAIPFDLFNALGEMERVRVHLLHEAPHVVHGIDVARGIETIVGTAGLMRSVDLVISVDSMPAHLAGALGVPVWTLLRSEADWRWMEERDDSPWYPTMRLFRQSQPGDWRSVVRRVTEELAECCERRSSAVAAGTGSDGI